MSSSETSAAARLLQCLRSVPDQTRTLPPVSLRHHHRHTRSADRPHHHRNPQKNLHQRPAKRFQKSTLRHWDAENCLHLETDKESGEDKHVFQSAALGEFGRF
ncbi:MAG: hypothetical protein LBH00_12440 [Planctomycetaceae bacterium]|nr:hypothetical protein [Planctomycetaceae bacterium]